MEGIRPTHALRIAIAAGLGLCLSLPLAAQDAGQDARANDRTQASANPGAAAATPAGSGRMADERFLTKATKGNEKEVAAATVALQKASSQDVREYANHLLRDHQDMLVKLDETAVALGVSQTRRYTAMGGWGSSEANVDASTAAGATHTGGTVTGRGSTGYETAGMASADANRSSTSMTTQAVPASASDDPAVRKLAGLSGASFDRAFADQMVTDHKKTIAEFERASDDKSLSAQTRSLASNALPKLRNHLAMAESLQGSLTAPAR